MCESCHQMIFKFDQSLPYPVHSENKKKLGVGLDFIRTERQNEIMSYSKILDFLCS